MNKYDVDAVVMRDLQRWVREQLSVINVRPTLGPIIPQARIRAHQEK